MFTVLFAKAENTVSIVLVKIKTRSSVISKLIW